MRGNLGHPKMHKTEASVWGVRAISKFYGLFFYEGEWFSALLIKNFSGRMVHTLNRAHHNTLKAYTSSISYCWGGASLTTIAVRSLYKSEY